MGLKEVGASKRAENQDMHMEDYTVLRKVGVAV